MLKAIIKKIKSKYILKVIFDYVQHNKCLEIIKYNKMIQNELEINKNYYNKFTQIEIEIIPTTCKYNNKFINVLNKEDKSYYHIYFNDNKNESHKYCFYKKDKLKKIKVIIDFQIKSFHKLFRDCECIESIKIIKCNRKDINDISQMFYGCSSLKELELSNFNTNNVTDMSWLFTRCISLKQLNLSNFDTSNVKNMSWMFYGCSSLQELNLSNFNTNNVTNMSCMFSLCLSLKELDLSNFNTLHVTNMNRMFFQCSDNLKKKIKKNYKNIIF